MELARVNHGRFKAGTIFKEEVIAKDYQDARQVALARNPNARVVGVNAK